MPGAFLWYLSQPLQVKLLYPRRWASFLTCSQVIGRRDGGILPAHKYFCAFTSVGLGFFVFKNSRLPEMISKFPVSLYFFLVVWVRFLFFFFGRDMWIGAVDIFGLQNGEQIEGTLSLVVASNPHPPLLCRGLPGDDQWRVCNTCCELSSETSLEAGYEGGQLSKGVCDSPQNGIGASLTVCVSMVQGRAWSWGSASPSLPSWSSIVSGASLAYLSQIDRKNT